MNHHCDNRDELSAGVHRSIASSATLVPRRPAGWEQDPAFWIAARRVAAAIGVTDRTGRTIR